MIVSIIVFIFILSILVFIHELGHFMVAKWVGMRVDEFAIGFPPTLFAKKKGETTYKINLLPIGGYVKIHGENPVDGDDDPRSFQNKSVLARVAVIVAGVIMNLVLAFILLGVAFSVGFPTGDTGVADIPGATILRNEVTISGVLKDSPAEKAEIKSGEVITAITESISGVTTSIVTQQDLVDYTAAHQADGLFNLVVILKDKDQVREVPVTIQETGHPLGVAIAVVQEVKVPVWRAPEAAFKTINYIITVTWGALKDFGGQLIHGRIDPNISGPVGIYQVSSSAAHQGVAAVVMVIAFLSVNLALINILPIPALDGGRLVFLIIEGIFRKRVVSHTIEQIFTSLGFLTLIALVILITIKDIIKLF